MQNASFFISLEKLSTFTINLHEFFWSDSIKPFYYACTCMNQAHHGENQNLCLKEFQQNKDLNLRVCKQDIQGV